MRNFFLYIGSGAFRKQLLIAIISIGTILCAIFFSLRFYTRHGEGISVPNLKGMNINDAITLLESSDLDYQVDSVFILDRKGGLVIEQDPDPNTNVKTNRTIYLTIVTSQAPDVKFPDIENKTFREALAILESYGLKLGDTTYTADIARDAVLEIKYGGQALKIGQDIPKGSRIDLVLGDGRGASENDVPDLTGLTLDEAVFSIRGANLTLGTVMYQGTITDSSKTVIMMQNPSPQDSIKKVSIGTPVNLVLIQKE